MMESLGARDEALDVSPQGARGGNHGENDSSDRSRNIGNQTPNTEISTRSVHDSRGDDDIDEDRVRSSAGRILDEYFRGAQKADILRVFHEEIRLKEHQSFIAQLLKSVLAELTYCCKLTDCAREFRERRFIKVRIAGNDLNGQIGYAEELRVDTLKYYESMADLVWLLAKDKDLSLLTQIVCGTLDENAHKLLVPLVQRSKAPNEGMLSMIVADTLDSATVS